MMTVDIQHIIRRGGRPLVDLLNYCVYSTRLDCLFLFLVGEYRMHPTSDKAIALYEMFCAPAAPARLPLDNQLPPKNPRLLQAIGPFVAERQPPAAPPAAPPSGERVAEETASLENAPEENVLERTDAEADPRPQNDSQEKAEVAGKGARGFQPLPNPMLLPPKYLFDGLSEAVRSGRSDPLRDLASSYDPARSPLENMPGGKMTAAQKHFVEYVWSPHVRPRLVGAGFRRIANIG